VKAQTKAHSYRFRGAVLRVAAWHGRPDIATIALSGSESPSVRALEELLERLRSDGYREVLTNALAPGAALPLVDTGFEVRTRLHLLERALDGSASASGRTERAGRGDRAAILDVDAKAFDDDWRFDDLALREAMRATPSTQLRVARLDDMIAGYGLFGRAEGPGYVQRLAVAPRAQGRGIGRALLEDGLHWLHRRGSERAFVNTQTENERALRFYEGVGFTRLPVGLCVLGRSL
jgi:GNAT superfamily N-acetyltransferase